MAQKENVKILIVDDEFEVAEIIEFLVTEYFPEGIETLIAHSGNEAVARLIDDSNIDLCICDHNMADGMGPVVLKHIIDAQLKTKFVLCSTVVPADKPVEYPIKYVYSNIQKPDIGGGIEKLVQLLDSKDSRPIDSFTPISIHILSLMEKIPTDIYIRMSDNKFIKCMNKFEFFTVDDEKKYSAKALEELFIKKDEDSVDINQVIFATLTKIMDKRHLPLTEKLSIAHSQLVGLIKFTGITEELALATKKNIDQSVALLMKSPVVADCWKNQNLLGDYPSKLYALHSLLSSVVVKKMHWHSEATFFKLTLASFLQDVSLDSIALMEICDYQEFLIEQSRFSAAEVKKFTEHPQKSVEIAAAFKEIPPDIDRILIEQHEMPEGNGFPKKLNANQLGPLSCLFILTGIFARFVLKEGDRFDLPKFVSHMEFMGYSRGNFKESFEVIKSFQKKS